jgi:hypothetical protein
VPPAEDDPVLRAIARAPIVPWTAEEDRALDDAQRAAIATGEKGRTLTYDELAASLRAHHGVTREEWHAAATDE